MSGHRNVTYLTEKHSPGREPAVYVTLPGSIALHGDWWFIVRSLGLLGTALTPPATGSMGLFLKLSSRPPLPLPIGSHELILEWFPVVPGASITRPPAHRPLARLPPARPPPVCPLSPVPA